jgi:adenine phosphoribosyltransferase
MCFVSLDPEAGKLPGAVESVAYVKEYGTDEFDIQVGAVKAGQNVVMVDDLLATVCFSGKFCLHFARNIAQLTGLASLVTHAQGGTFLAGRQLLERVGARVVDCLCVIELSDLKGREALAPSRVSSIFQY